MLQLVEIEGRVNEMGAIEIPAVVLAQTGIVLGDTVKMIYMAGEENLESEAKEFLLVKGDQSSVEELLKEQRISFQIPQELLVDAGIPLDADLDIVCRDQKIIILPADPVTEVVLPKELLDICEELGVSKDKVQIIVKALENEDEKNMC